MSWEYHPASNLFPMMGAAELQELADDIKAHGQREPITTCEGLILDGRNRLLACEMAGVAPSFAPWVPDGQMPLEYVISANLHRRHLTTSQRAAISEDLRPLLAEEARKRQLAGLRRGTAPAPLPPKEGNGDRHAGEAAAQAAELMGVSRSSSDRARIVKERSPELFEQIKRGEKTVTRAAQEVGWANGHEGQTRNQPKPFNLDTKRKRDLANGAKARLEGGLSEIHGICRGIKELDMRMIASVLTKEEISVWAAKAGELSNVLRNLKTNLLEVRSDTPEAKPDNLDSGQESQAAPDSSALTGAIAGTAAG